MLLLLPTAAILKGLPAGILGISVASEQRRGKLCHSISIQLTYFIRQLSVENIRVFIFVSVTPLYSSGGPSNMAAVGFSFPKIDAQSSPIFQISGIHTRRNRCLNNAWTTLLSCVSNIGPTILFWALFQQHCWAMMKQQGACSWLFIYHDGSNVVQVLFVHQAMNSLFQHTRTSLLTINHIQACQQSKISCLFLLRVYWSQ